MKDIFTLRLSARVARLGSFSAAARECGLTQPQSSRIVAELEATLGVRLLSRTTRAVVPTEVGQAFLTRIEPILAASDDAEDSVRDGAGYRGTVRISLATSLGIRRIIPRLSSFVENHPDLIAAAVAGIGVTSTNAWACRREMDDELLVRLLPEWARRGHEGLDASTATGY